ncbi:MAG TPA: pilin, partial [Candidatus Saccharimonadales bacterium]|nr:pilin [Candidatus Saccharimonadales bacterium]
MGIPVDVPLSLLANASFASEAMRDYITPVIATLCGLAGLACAFFLINGGIQYMTSSGNPEKMERAKKIIKNALIGLVLVLAAATLTAILSNAYSSSGASPTEKFPTLQPIEPADDGTNFFDVIIKAVVAFLRNIVQSVGEPFLNALGYFINRTPLMGDNASVFNLWLAVVGITDVLFILVVALIGFKVMSVSTFGLD